MQQMPNTKPANTKPQMRSTRDQMIIKLLMEVSDRLKSSEHERKLLWQELEEYRQIITDLEDKSSKSEQAYLSIEHRMSQKSTESRLAELSPEYKKKIEMLFRDAKRERETLNGKIEQTATQQQDIENRMLESEEQTQRLIKKVEKVHQDKRRIFERLEQVEDTVTLTRQALEAKAMVLLTDQSAVAKFSTPAIGADDHDILETISNDNASRSWKKTFQGSTALIASFVVLSIFAGVGIGQMAQSPQSSQQFTVLDEQTLARLSQGQASGLNAIQSASGTTSPQTQSQYNAVDSVIERALNNNDPMAQKTQKTMAAVNDFPVAEKNQEKSVSTNRALANQLLSQPEKGAEAERILKIPETTQPIAKVSQTVEQEIAPKEITVAKIVQPVVTPKAPKIVAVKNLEPKAPEPSSDSDLSQTYDQTRILEKHTIDRLLRQRNPQPINERLRPDNNLPEILSEVEQKALAGMAEAQHDLGAIYTAGHAGVERDFDRAIQWFRESAFGGISNARYNLGVLYHQGLGIDKDMEQAIEWYQAASYLGHPEAQYNLGIAHIEAIGTPYAPKRAAAYFEQAAMGGVVEAAYNLGLIYENALLGNAQLDEALFWYKIAADQGNADALQASQNLAGKMGFNTQDVTKLVDQMKLLKPAFTSKQAALKNSEAGKMQKQVELIRQVQIQLTEGGFYSGNADGITGPMTREAIQSYQAQKGIDIDGAATEDLLVHMLSSALNYTNTAAGN